MKIRNVKAKPGEKVFGYLESSRTASQIPIHIPLNIVSGAQPGPTLLVMGAVHGSEIGGTLGLGKVLRELDPKELNGTLLAIPVFNTSGFEFDTREIYWDYTNFNAAKGLPSLEGTPSQQLAWMFMNELVPRADAIVDIHSGKSRYHIWYTIYPGNHSNPDVAAKSRDMALAFGLEHVARSTPDWGVPKDQRVEFDIPSIVPEVGGGANFMMNGKEQLEASARGITNVMKLMGMLEGRIETESSVAKIYDIHCDINAGNKAGIMLLECQWGDYLEQGDVYASVYNPLTGERTGEIVAPRDGLVFNGAHIWPVINQGDWLGILASKVEEVELDF